MGAAERRALIQAIQKEREGRLCITYVTSTRLGHEIQIADDVLPLLFEHLEKGKAAEQPGVDLFIHSNGGSGTVPWRVVNLVREYTKHLAVLVPHKAFSAATLIALGADEIVMHRMGCLGPIDPSVTNAFNPPHPQVPGQLAAISVEDVTAYFKLLKEEVGIRHEDELIKGFNELTGKVHPLALGNVQRSHHQARMLARKLLKTHGEPGPEHEIDKIIDDLKSNLFFHGHPINRTEAKNDLKLRVTNAKPELEQAMWSLYAAYNRDLLFDVPLNGLHELDTRSPPPSSQMPPTVQEVVQQMTLLAQAGLGLGALNEEQLVKMAVAMIPALKGSATAKPKVRLEGIVGACVESTTRSDIFKTDLAFERGTANVGGSPQEVVKQEILWQRWEQGA